MTTVSFTTLYGVWGDGPNNVFAVGMNGVIQHYDGKTWSAMDSGTTETLYSISGTTASDVYAVGQAGTVLHYDGYAWSRMASGTTGDIAAVWAGHEAFAVGHAGLALHYRRFCAASETTCNDGQDEDCDGYADCADSDCSTNASCTSGGLCAGATTIMCNQAPVQATTVGANSTMIAYGCDPWLEDGRERMYKLVPASNVTVTASLTGLTNDLDLVVAATGLGGGCDPSSSGCLGASSKGIKTCSGGANAGLSCVAAGDCPGGTCLLLSPIPSETVTFSAQSGKAYYIIVDGYGSNAGSYTLGVTCQ
jgi:hypothetical protein